MAFMHSLKYVAGYLRISCRRWIIKKLVSLFMLRKMIGGGSGFQLMLLSLNKNRTRAINPHDC